MVSARRSALGSQSEREITSYGPPFIAFTPGVPCGATLSHAELPVWHWRESRGAGKGAAGGVAPTGRLHCLSAERFDLWRLLMSGQSLEI
jgi:hypothetical protein